MYEMTLNFSATCKDVHEIVEMAEEYASSECVGVSFFHCVDESGCDFWCVDDSRGILPDTFRPSEVSESFVRFVFYRRPDLFPVFMHGNGVLDNGGNMTPEIAFDIIDDIF